MRLKDFFAAHPLVALAFSGGTDSAYLLWAALEAGARVRPYFVRSPFQPAFELEDARRLCAQLGAELRVLELDVLALPQVASNGPDRCYHCKRAIFSAILSAAGEEGISTVIDGTNASDCREDRPGMRALEELGVLSPLREAGLTKGEIRRLSKEARLFTAGKPAYACLATRVPTGRRIEPRLLSLVEEAEAGLTEMGYINFRVRLREKGALIQLDESQLRKGSRELGAIREKLGGLLGPIELDPRGRSSE